MVRVLSVSAACPPHRVDPTELKSYLAASLTRASAERFSRILDRSQVRSRHTIAPLSELIALRTIEERAHRFAQHSVALGEAVAQRALSESGIDRTEITTLVSVSSTGYTAPSLDAYLVERLGLSPSVRRVPITQLGCSGGVSAVAIASELVRAGRGSALVISVELCSLCLQNTDPSRTDLIASILFGDGAAAAVLSRCDDRPGAEVLAVRSVLLAGSENRVGIARSTSGLRLVLSRELPSIIRAALPKMVGDFLGANGLTTEDLSFWLVHPGGPRVLEAVEQSFDLADGTLRHSWDVWRECGNMSSATALFVLDRWLSSAAARERRGVGLLLAFGPGVSCEMLLTRFSQPTPSSC